MAPPSEAPPLRLQRNRGDGDPLLDDSTASAQQSGRSATSLNAEVSAAQIRYASLPTLASTSSLAPQQTQSSFIQGSQPTVTDYPFISFNPSPVGLPSPSRDVPQEKADEMSNRTPRLLPIDTSPAEKIDQPKAEGGEDLIALSSPDESPTRSIEAQKPSAISTDVAKKDTESKSSHSPKARTSGDTGSSLETSRQSQGAAGHSSSIANLAPYQPRQSRGSGTGSPQAASQEMSQSNQASPLLARLFPYEISNFGKDLTRYHYHDVTSPRSSFVSSEGSFKDRNSQISPMASGKDKGNPFLSASEVELNQPPANSPAVRSFSPFLGNNLMASNGQYKFAMFMDEQEDDDDMHAPGDDDDSRSAPSFRRMFCAGPRSFIHAIGLGIFMLGLLFLFVGWPILSKVKTKETVAPPSTPPHAKTWDWVTDEPMPLFKNIRKDLVDPDTPKSAYTRTGVDGEELQLVFSDEFNVEGRTFYPEDDPYWYAPDLWYGATQDLEWYSPDAVTTKGGALEIRMDKIPNHNLQYQSGMLNSWNQLCFKGGRLEVSVSLPGPGGVMGLWPGIWTLGNLARPGYLSTSHGTWPYTYTECDSGITPNQSMTDGTSKLPGQKLSACTCDGEDHPSPGTGRGAPEIDVFEASSDWSGQELGVATQSLQVAPFDIWWYPNSDFTAYPDRSLAYPNGWTGGPFQEALSGTAMLNNKWYDGIEYQKYAFEYTPGTGEDGKITWFVADDISWYMDGRAIGPNGNIGARQVPEEPMSIVMNLGISNSWASINWDHLRFPTTMRVDYVRLYQDPDNQMVTCDPPGYETTEYIQDHIVAYTNPNLTKWEQTGYDWPRNEYMHGCG